MNRYSVSFMILTILIFLPMGTDDCFTSALLAQESASSVMDSPGYEKSAVDAFNSGNYKKAVDDQSVAILLSEKKGVSSAVTGLQYNTLGMYQYHAGDFKASRISYEKALSLTGLENPSNRITLALIYGGAGSACQMTGDYTQAIIYCEKALELYSRSTLAKEQQWYPASVYYSLGLIYQYTGDYQKSDSYFQKSRDGYTLAFGAKHPYVAATLYGMGETAKLRGDHKAAKEFFNSTLEIYTSVYGENHPYVGTVYYALAYECHFEGDLSKSVTYYLRAIELYRKTYGERSSFTAIAYYGLGRVFADSGDAKRALEYLEKAREVDLAVFGEEHINTIATLFGIAGLLEKTGRIEEAMVIMSRTLFLQKKSSRRGSS